MVDATIDWTTVSSLATAGGTLVLAVATFSAVRSANRSARFAERTLLAGTRPLLIEARPEDPAEKIMWIDAHWSTVGAGKAVVETDGDVIYLAMPLHNAGTGIAILDGWHPSEAASTEARPSDPDAFRRMSRDLYIPAGGTGYWQGALREPSEQIHGETLVWVRGRRRFTIDLLYADSEGGQRTISRFSLTPKADSIWVAAVSKHWNLDRDDPR